MNIFNKAALQSMKKSRTRTIVTIIGVILSATMITAVATFAVSLQDYLVRSSAQKYGDWHVAFLDVDSSFARAREEDAGVQNAVSTRNIGYATFEGGLNPSKPYLFIAGFNEEAFDSLPIKLTSGRLPKNDHEVLIPSHVAENGGVHFSVGDTLSLAVGDRMRDGGRLDQHDPFIVADASMETLVQKVMQDYTVVGICERPAFEEYAAPGYTLITSVTQGGADADSYSVFVTLSNPYGVRAYAKNMAESHDYIFNDEVLRFMGLSDDTLFNALLFAVVGILVALIMVGSIFLIYNAFNISLNERTRQFGILSSVGATAKQLQGSVLFEGLCIAAIGVPVGVLAGIGSIRLVILLIAGNFKSILSTDVPITMKISAPVLVIAAIISLATILISAYIPARKAARRPVMESIRQTNEVKIESGTVRTSRFAQRVYGLEGTLALKNFKRNKRRYRSIVLSLTLSVVLFVSASAFGAHLKAAAQKSVLDTDYDICFTTQDMDEDELLRLGDELKAVSGVYESAYQAISTFSCPVRASVLSDRYRESADIVSLDETADLSMDIQFIEDKIFFDFIQTLGLLAEDYSGQNPQMIAVAKAKAKADGDTAGQSRLYNMFESPSVTLAVSPGEKDISVTFVDTIPMDTLPRKPFDVKDYTFMVVAPYQLKDSFVNADTLVDMGLTFLSESPSQSVAEMEAILQEADITAAYTLYNVHQVFEQNRNIVIVMDVFTYIFVAMISLIAVANVLNTISTNIRLRRRELAMLRSVGMADRSFGRMMNFECAFFGVRTLLFGLPSASILSWLIYTGLGGGADLDFIFPWGSLAISVLGVFAIVFITTRYAIRKIKKENIIDALRDDMT